MILDWFHRKFLERYLYLQSEITYNPNCCNNYGEDFNNQQNDFNKSPVYGHRYRYYIPQMNPIRNPIDPNIPDDKVVKDTDSKGIDKTPATEATPAQHREHHKPKRTKRIKLFYVVPTNRKELKPEQQHIPTDFLKQVGTIGGPLLVIPLPVQSFQPHEAPESTEVVPEKESDTKPISELILKDAEQPIQTIGDVFDAKQQIGDVFDGENNDWPNDSDNYVPEGDFFEGPFMEYNMHCSRKCKANKNDTRPTPISKCFVERKMCQSEEDDFDDLCLNDSWSGDITFQIPATNEYFRKKLKNTEEQPNRPGVFLTFLKKFLFKESAYEENDEYPW